MRALPRSESPAHLPGGDEIAEFVATQTVAALGCGGRPRGANQEAGKDRPALVLSARYVDLLQDGRLEWLIQNGLLRPVIQRRMAFLVAGVGGVYRHDIPRMAAFVLHTRVCSFDERWLYFEQTFRLGREGEGKTAARFITRGMIRASEGALPPRESLRRCGGVLPEVSPEPPTDLAAWCRAQDACLEVLRGSSGAPL